MKTIKKELLDAIIEELKQQAESYKRIAGYKRNKSFSRRYKGISAGLEKAIKIVTGMLLDDEYNL